MGLLIYLTFSKCHSCSKYIFRYWIDRTRQTISVVYSFPQPLLVHINDVDHDEIQNIQKSSLKKKRFNMRIKL